MLSGIGIGIDVVHDAPEVGNLSDHLCARLGFDAKRDTLFAAERPWHIAIYLLRRRGMLTDTGAENYGFVRSRSNRTCHI